MNENNNYLEREEIERNKIRSYDDIYIETMEKVDFSCFNGCNSWWKCFYAEAAEARRD